MRITCRKYSKSSFWRTMDWVIKVHYSMQIVASMFVQLVKCCGTMVSFPMLMKTNVIEKPSSEAGSVTLIEMRTKTALPLNGHSPGLIHSERYSSDLNAKMSIGSGSITWRSRWSISGTSWRKFKLVQSKRAMAQQFAPPDRASWAKSVWCSRLCCSQKSYYAYGRQVSSTVMPSKSLD